MNSGFGNFQNRRSVVLEVHNLETAFTNFLNIKPVYTYKFTSENMLSLTTVACLHSTIAKFSKNM